MQSKLSALRGHRTSVPGKILLISLLLFGLGAAVGIYSGGYVQYAVDGGRDNTLTSYFSSISSTGLEGRSFGNCFLNNLLPAVFSAFLGTSLFGWLLLPAYLMYRGFALGFSAATTVIIAKDAAVKTVFGLLGVDAFLIMPCVFVVSALAIDSSLSLYRLSDGSSREKRSFLSGVLKCLLLSGAVALAATFIEVYLSSRLI